MHYNITTDLLTYLLTYLLINLCADEVVSEQHVGFGLFSAVQVQVASDVGVFSGAALSVFIHHQEQ